MHSKGHFTIVRLEVGARSRSRCAGAIGSYWTGTVYIYRLQLQGVHDARVGPSCVFFCLIRYMPVCCTGKRICVHLYNDVRVLWFR